MKRRTLVIAALLAAGLIWVATIGAAFQAIRRFETTPGAAAVAPSSWPASTRVQRASDWTLVMLIHPHCSCSRASVQELQAVIEHAPAIRTTILVYRPSDFARGWENTEVVKAASRLRRARVVIDEDGREARLFGGFTSGQTFLFDRNGKLRFSGGITSLRGHAGINRGRTGIIDIVRSRPARASHPVFGCAIASFTAKEQK
jgi:hypothetical protein